VSLSNFCSLVLLASCKNFLLFWTKSERLADILYFTKTFQLFFQNYSKFAKPFLRGIKDGLTSLADDLRGIREQPDLLLQVKNLKIWVFFYTHWHVSTAYWKWWHLAHDELLLYIWWKIILFVQKRAKSQQFSEVFVL